MSCIVENISPDNNILFLFLKFQNHYFILKTQEDLRKGKKFEYQIRVRLLLSKKNLQINLKILNLLEHNQKITQLFLMIKKLESILMSILNLIN